MAGFLIIDFDLFTKYPDLSDGARMLYAFIQYKMKVANTDENGDKYINYSGDNDPRIALGISKRQLLYRSDELKAAGLIHTDGQRWNFRVYLGNKNVTKIEDTKKSCIQKCNQVGDKNVTKLATKMSPSPLYINIEQVNNKQNTQCVINIPTLKEVREEIAARKYRIADPQKFLDYNEANGWRIKDWKKALALWAKNEGKQRQGIRSASITGAEAGIIYDCAIDIKQQDPAQITAEEISAEYIPEDKTDYTIETDLDAIIDIFGG